MFIRRILNLFFFLSLTTLTLAQTNTPVKAQVSGKVDKVLVKKNTTVDAKKLLITLDKRYYQEQLTRSQKAYKDLQLKAQRQDLKNLKSAKAHVTQLKKAYQQAQQEYLQRFEQAEKRGYDQATMQADAKQVAAKRAALKKAKADYVEAHIAYQHHQFGTQNQQLHNAKISVATAKANLSATNIYAPHAGKVSRIFVKPGSRIYKGQTLLTLTP